MRNISLCGILTGCGLDVYVRTVSAYIEKVEKTRQDMAVASTVPCRAETLGNGFATQANYGQDFLLVSILLNVLRARFTLVLPLKSIMGKIFCSFLFS